MGLVPDVSANIETTPGSWPEMRQLLIRDHAFSGCQRPYTQPPAFRMKATVLSLAVVLSLQPFVQGDLISDLGAVLSGTADCSLCPNLLAGFKGIAALGDGFFVQILTNVCKSQVSLLLLCIPLHLLTMFISLRLTRMSAKAPLNSKDLPLLMLSARVPVLGTMPRSSAALYLASVRSQRLHRSMSLFPSEHPNTPRNGGAKVERR